MENQVTLNSIQLSIVDIQSAIADIRSSLLMLTQTVGILVRDVAILKQDVSELKQDVAVLKQDVAELKHDMLEVKQDIVVLKRDMLEVKQDVAILKQDMIEVKQDIQTSLEVSNTFAQYVENRFSAMDARFDKIESRMLTNTHFDYKMADVRGEQRALLRKEDKRVDGVVDTLCVRRVFTTKDKTQLAAMSPFSLNITTSKKA